MFLSQQQKILGIVGGILGLLQGIAWFLMSLLCIIYHYKGARVDPTSSSFGTVVYLRLLNSDGYFPEDIIVTPNGFIAFMWLYILLNFSWISFAVDLLRDVAKDREESYKSMRWFAIVDCFISVLDVILIFCLGLDYGSSCTGEITNVIRTICQNGVIPVVIIVAKGGILWIINIVLGYILFRQSNVVKKAAEIELLERQRQAAKAEREANANRPVGTRLGYRYEYRWGYKMEPRLRLDPITGREVWRDENVYGYRMESVPYYY